MINTKSLIETINQQLPNIENLFSSLYPDHSLTRKGGKLWALCPYHPEKTASFMIDPEKNRAHCFSCRWSGDRIDLWLSANNLTLRDGGIKRLTDSLGISTNLTQEERANLKRRQKIREQEASQEEKLKNLIEAEYNRLIGMEKWIHSILKTIEAYGENVALALERPAVLWALKNRDRVEYYLDQFNVGNDEDKLELITITRGLDVLAGM